MFPLRTGTRKRSAVGRAFRNVDVALRSVRSVEPADVRRRRAPLANSIAETAAEQALAQAVGVSAATVAAQLGRPVAVRLEPIDSAGPESAAAARSAPSEPQPECHQLRQLHVARSARAAI